MKVFPGNIMTFGEFCYIRNYLWEQFYEEKRRKRFQIKLNDGDTIEFYLNPEYDLRKLFVTQSEGWGDNIREHGFLSVRIRDKETENVNFYTVPCGYISYINVELLKEKDNIDNKMIAW